MSFKFLYHRIFYRSYWVYIWICFVHIALSQNLDLFSPCLNQSLSFDKIPISICNVICNRAPSQSVMIVNRSLYILAQFSQYNVRTCLKPGQADQLLKSNAIWRFLSSPYPLPVLEFTPYHAWMLGLLTLATESILIWSYTYFGKKKSSYRISPLTNVPGRGLTFRKRRGGINYGWSDCQNMFSLHKIMCFDYKYKWF